MKNVAEIGRLQPKFGAAEFAAASRAAESWTVVSGRTKQDSVREMVAPAEGGLRLRKVERLRRAIAAGTYSVSAAELAEKMIGAMLK